MTLEIETIGYGPLTFILTLKSLRVGGGWWVVNLDYSISECIMTSRSPTMIILIFFASSDKNLLSYSL